MVKETEITYPLFETNKGDRLLFLFLKKQPVPFLGQLPSSSLRGSLGALTRLDKVHGKDHQGETAQNGGDDVNALIVCALPPFAEYRRP